MNVSDGIQFFDKVVPFKELPLGTVLFLARNRETRMKPDLYYPVHFIGFNVDYLGNVTLTIRLDDEHQGVRPDMLCFDIPT